MNKTLLIFLLMPALVKCKPFQSPERLRGPFRLEGELPFHKGEIYLSYVDANGHDVRDSIPIENGYFALLGRLQEPQLAECKIVEYSSKDGRERAIERADWKFLLEPTSMEVRSGEDPTHPSISGGRLNAELDTLRRLKQAYQGRIMELRTRSNQMRQTKSAASDSLEKLIEKMQEDELDSLYGPWLLSHRQGYIAFFALKEYVRQGMNADKIADLYRKIPATFHALPSGIKMQKQIDLAQAVDLGRTAINFEQPDTAGKLVRLTDFRGKYLLLDFWASWCGPCRAESPVVRKAYQDFKTGNFTILSISLDFDRAIWIKAIRQDSLCWTQAGDMTWDNAVAKLYNIDLIPSNVLIDPSGIILAKNLHGPALEEELIKVLKK